MINGKKVLAIIPARGGSKGLPRKNIRDLCGKPLIAWSIEQALACAEIDKTVVSTDDEEIAQIAKNFGAEVPFMRPEPLASDTASSADVILHALDFYADKGQHYDVIVLVEPTSPLREVDDLSGAINQLIKSPGLRSVVGVSAVESNHPSFLFRVQEGELRPYLGKQPTGLRRQDIEELFFLEGSVYVSDVEVFREKRSFYHEKTGPWIVPRYKSLEIDEIVDLITAEALMSARQEGRI
ncbi:MAG: acylneuraminate cytidylyltransferase family protein [Bdellovibrio sp.]